MLIRQPWFWIAVAALAAALWSAVQPASGDATKKPATAPDLFPFVQALPADPEESVQAAQEDVPAGSAHAASPQDPAALVAAHAYRTEAAVRAMRVRGASDDEVYRARAAAMNPETAAALARLDHEDAVWQQRVNAYLAQRPAAGDDPQAIQALKDGLFSAEEQTRLAAYEPAPAPLPGLPQ